MGVCITFMSFLFTLVAATSGTQNMSLSCPREVFNNADIYYLQHWQDLCLKFVLTEKISYIDASRHCISQGGSLVLPKTEELNSFITDKLLTYYDNQAGVWIGLHDKIKEGTFVWEDLTGLEWNNFAKGQGPGRGKISTKWVEDCVSLDPKDGGKWHDFMCGSKTPLETVTWANSKKHFVCQYRYNGENTRTQNEANKGESNIAEEDVEQLEEIPQDAEADELNNAEWIEAGDQEETINEDSGFSDQAFIQAVVDDGCPTFDCDEDCGMSGYRKDKNNCQMCECN